MTRGGRGRYPRFPGGEECLEIAEDGSEGEEGGEGVLALGDPGDGFDAEGVEGPEGGREEGEPGTANGCFEDEVEEDGVGCVEEDVGQVVSPGVEGRGSEEEGINEIGDPEERGVHAMVAMEGGECPSDGRPGKAFVDDGVVDDEEGVVKADQVVADGGSEEGKGENEKKNGGEECTETGFHGGKCSRGNDGCTMQNAQWTRGESARKIHQVPERRPGQRAMENFPLSHNPMEEFDGGACDFQQT